jgi:replicative DNA helicase
LRPRPAKSARRIFAEQRLLEFLIHDAGLRSIILPQLEETDFEALATAGVFRALLTLQRNGEEITAENLTNLVSDDSQAEDILPILLMSEPPREPDEAIDEVLAEAEKCVFTLRGMAIANRILEISQELVNAERNGDIELRDQLVREQIELARLKYEIEKANVTDAES